MARYYVINEYSGESYSKDGYDDIAFANEVCNRLNRECDTEDGYSIYTEEEYYEMLGEQKIANAPVYSVYGVGKYSDAYPPMEELIMAEKPSEARKLFETKHPEYRAVGAYRVC